MKAARRERERSEAMVANMRSAAHTWRMTKLWAQSFDAEQSDFVKGAACQLDRWQYPRPGDKPETRGGMRVVTYAELEARQDKIAVQNIAAMGRIMGSQKGK